LYGFPGEVPEDYERNLELARVLTHLHPPSGCGPIRMDRFSPNFDRAEEKGLVNVRPFKCYRFIYAFNTETLLKLIYYFDFDYREKIDDGGHLPALKDAIEQWHNHQDQLYAERVGEKLLIHDTRPVAIWPDTYVEGLAARVYEFCDRIQTLPRIIQTMQE